VLELDASGGFTRRSHNRATALARDPVSGTVFAVGATVERWNGSRFEPVWFRLQHPRRPAGSFALPPALDAAADARGRLHVLYPEGHLATLTGDGELLRLLDFEDGVPRTAQRLLYLRAADRLAVGSLREGLVLLAPD
jgi:hypothetical protein